MVVGCIVIATLFISMSAIALIKKRDSVYDNKPNEKNPMENKRVAFAECSEDEENADGIRGHLEVIGISDFRRSFYDRVIKRGMDIVLSFIGLILLSPLFLIIGLWIYKDDPGNVLFIQKRVGKNKRYFKLHKFRSMKMSTPHDKPTHMLENPEQYMTKAGKFIRDHSLDELPQIWDIFIGNMSIIGPRSALWNQDFLTAERDKYNANEVRPGLTGWAQINGRDRVSIPEKAKLDGVYVEKLSFCMDIKCFIRSLGVFGGDNDIVDHKDGLPEKNKEK